MIRFVKIICLLAGLCLLGDCSVPENQNLPPHLTRMKPEHNSRARQRKQAKWERFAKAIGIGNNHLRHSYGTRAREISESELRDQLSNPSEWLTNKDLVKDRYIPYLLDKAAPYLAARQKHWQCDRILDYRRVRRASRLLDAKKETLEELRGPDAALVYQIWYALKGDVDPVSHEPRRRRSALVTVPIEAKDGGVPLILYTHGGDKGLYYKELASILGELQGSHITFAPSYPGEPICRSDSYRIDGQLVCAEDPAERAHQTLFSAQGETSPWDSDVEEALGLHDCIVRAIKPDSGVIDEESKLRLFANLIRKRVRKVGEGFFEDTPASAVMGISRGGLVAGLVLSHAGALLNQLSSSGELEELQKFNARFACGMTIAAPSSVTVGRFRLVLEALVKGDLRYMTIRKAPGLEPLASLFDEYRNDQSDSPEILDRTIFELFRRDLLFLSPLAVAGLREYSRMRYDHRGDNSHFPLGSMLFMHGVEDGLVPFEQTQAAYNVFREILHNDLARSKLRIPGQNEENSLGLFARGLAYLDPVEDAQRRELTFMHFDHHFQKSVTYVPDDFVVPKTKKEKALKASVEDRDKYLQWLYSEAGKLNTSFLHIRDGLYDQATPKKKDQDKLDYMAPDQFLRKWLADQCRF